jgi:hypothetical protein
MIMQYSVGVDGIEGLDGSRGAALARRISRPV